MDENNTSSSKNEQFVKRNSLMADDLDMFDPSELEDDDFNDVFDDEELNEGLEPSMLMPPPADKKGNTSSNTSTTISLSNLLPAADIQSQEAAKRRRRTAAQLQKAEKGLPPPTWHSEAADLPHRQAMIRDM